MASLQKIAAKRKKSGGKGASAKYLWRMQFDVEGKRITLRLGLMSEKSAYEIGGHIDHLIESRKYKTGTSEATKSWLQTADEALIAKLHSLRLCGVIQNPTVEAFAIDFLQRKKRTTKAGTLFLIDQVTRHLVEYFGQDKRLSEVTRTDAKLYWDWLLATKGIGINTAKRQLGRVREIFNEAREVGAVSVNPFQMRSLPVSVGVGLKHYIEASTIKAVIDHLPMDKLEWKLLLAFGRFVGCRIPSEIENLTWEDVNWERNTILLRSPKTEHYEGKSERLVPIFPEVSELLLSQAESRPDKSLYVFPQLRKHTNTATTAKKMVTMAGFESWPKFWNSLRASRETELMDLFGLRKACAWIGNSPLVAMKHYALLRQSDYLDVGTKSDVIENGTIHTSLEIKGLTATKSDAKSDEVQARTREHSGTQNVKNPGKPRLLLEKTTPHGFEP